MSNYLLKPDELNPSGSGFTSGVVYDGADLAAIPVTGSPDMNTVLLAINNHFASIDANFSNYYTISQLNGGQLDTRYYTETECGTLFQTLALKNAANGYAGLDASTKLLVAQLPSIAITSTQSAASQVAMLALTAEQGDIALRTDLNATYILQGTNPAVLGNWAQLSGIVGSGTANYIPKFTNAGAGIIVGDSPLFVKNSNSYISLNHALPLVEFDNIGRILSRESSNILSNYYTSPGGIYAQTNIPGEAFAFIGNNQDGTANVSCVSYGYSISSGGAIVVKTQGYKAADGTHFGFRIFTNGERPNGDVNIWERFDVSPAGNVGIGFNAVALANRYGADARAVLAMYYDVAGAAPTTIAANTFQMYATDIVAGNTAPHFMTELGHVIKLFKGSAFTQTYSTASTTVAANTGIDNAQAGAVYATLADLNNVTKNLNSVIDLLQANGLAG